MTLYKEVFAHMSTLKSAKLDYNRWCVWLTVTLVGEAIVTFEGVMVAGSRVTLVKLAGKNHPLEEAPSV